MKRNQWRDAAMLAAGTIVGAVLGRIVSPHVAQLTGFTRAKTGGGDAFAELTADHKRMLAAIEAAIEARGGARMPMLIAIKAGLAKHAMAEEDVIYPLLRDRTGAGDAVDRLYCEHGDMKTELYRIETALETGDDEGYRRAMQALRDEVATHAQDEETTQFPRLREVLDATKRAAVTAQVDREKALVA